MYMTNGYYTLLELFNTTLKEKGFNVVTYGTTIEVDIDRQTIFPYAHIIPGTCSMGEQTSLISFEVIGADLVDFSKNEVTDDFIGNSNLQDVHQDILGRLQSFIKRLDAQEDFVFEGVTIDPYQERFKNVLAGWTVNFTVEFKNIDDGRC